MGSKTVLSIILVGCILVSCKSKELISKEVHNVVVTDTIHVSDTTHTIINEFNHGDTIFKVIQNNHVIYRERTRNENKNHDKDNNTSDLTRNDFSLKWILLLSQVPFIVVIVLIYILIRVKMKSN